MNRNALLIYLHDLRDLEAAKYQIEKMRRQNYTAGQSEINAVDDKERYKRMPGRDYVGLFKIGAMFIIITLVCYWLSTAGEGDFGYSISLLYRKAQKWMCQEEFSGLFGEDFNFLFVLWSGIVSVIFIVSAFSKYIQYKRNYCEVKKYNEEEKYRIINQKNKIEKITSKYNLKQRQLENEFRKVSALLEEAYRLNILAKPYRNLSSVYYIYEYMSTSQSSLEETLIHERMENGIQRIEKKLDIIIEQNDDIIFKARQIEANTSRTVEQTTEMLNNLQKSLESQQRTEQNTLEAAQYASICATYSKTTAFFSVANYLSDRKTR